MHDETELQIRIDGDATSPTLIYLPGLHGDWTLLPGFREVAKARFRLVQFTYPRTVTWSLDDYAQAVDQQLKTAGIRSGWILAESFSSQVAWAWLKTTKDRTSDFAFDGIILAGGFVRYPAPLSLAAARLFFAFTPWWLWRLLFNLYLAYSGFRHRNAGPAGNCAREFIARRTPQDIQAMRARLKLIASADFREVARKVTCPIFQLAGIIDPVVPPALVARWLRRKCPTFRGTRVIWPADHNVLGTEPAQALAQIEHWISASACLHEVDSRT